MSLSTRPIAICSCSVGRAFAGHPLLPKLEAISNAGFRAVELFIEDLEWLAHDSSAEGQPFSSSFSNTPLNLPSRPEMFAAAKAMRIMCDDLGLEVITIQPLQSFEGTLDPERRQQVLSKASLYLELARILGAKILQVTSHYDSEGTTGDVKELAKDMGLLADMAKGYGITIAYEGICWAAHVNTWQKAYQVVQLADRKNLGILLDTYHILAAEWADPTMTNGLREPTVHASNARLQRSLDQLQHVPNDKIVYIQLSDALRLDRPLDEDHAFWDSTLKGPLHMWSRNGRVFPYEGYTPVDMCVRAMLIDRDYPGWVSIETFCESMREPEEGVPEEHARRGMLSWKKLVGALSDVAT